MIFPRTNLLLIFLIVSHTAVCSYAQQFQVLKISGVHFPSTAWGKGEGKNKGVVSINASYTKSFQDFTVCYRLFVDSYNDGLFAPIATWPSKEFTGGGTMLDRIGWYGTGFESEGLQGGVLVISRNVTGGGIGGKNLPWYHLFVYPKDIVISKWHQICFSYSNTLNHLHLYIDGLKAFSFNFQDESQPFEPNLFEHTRLGHNLRGSLTDLQIYDSFYDEGRMISRTKTCEEEPGEIFTWDKSRINILLEVCLFSLYVSIFFFLLYI